jgi:hypothetical protein
MQAEQYKLRQTLIRKTQALLCESLQPQREKIQSVQCGQLTPLMEKA